MKINEKINLAKIIFDFYCRDIKLIVDKNKDLFLKEDVEELRLIANCSSCQTLIEGINNFWCKSVKKEDEKLSFLMLNLLQRYNYFYQTIDKWNKYFNNIEFKNDLNKQDLFLNYISPFFNDQILDYASQFLTILNDFSDQNQTSKAIEKLKNYLDKMIETKNFVLLLDLFEQFTIYLQDHKNLYKELKDYQNHKQKELVLSYCNEFKIIFQAINNLIVEILAFLNDI